MDVFVEQVINGLALAGVYLLVALGITLIFGLTRLVFFAQGELVSLGGFLTLTLVDLKVPIVLSLIIAAVAVGLAGEVLDLAILRRTLSHPINGFVMSLGLIVAFEAAYSIIFPQAIYLLPPLIPGTWNVGGIFVEKERVLLLVVTAVVAGGLFLFLHRTHYGRGIRALSENRVSARALGVPVGTMISVVFFVGCALAGLAGGLLGTIFPFTAVTGSTWLIVGFSVAIIGGMGNVRGAVVAAVIVALAQTLFGAYISLTWSYAFLLVTMVVILLLRPNGIFGSAAGDPLAGGHGSTEGRESEAPAILAVRRLARIVVVLPRLVLPALVAFCIVLPLVLGSVEGVTNATFGLVSAMAVYSFWFAYRNAGIFAIAQAAFLGIGAYTATIFATDLSVPFWIQIVAGTLLAALGAAIFAIISLRAAGSYFVILLFALNALLVEVINQAGGFTGGTYGIVLVTPANPLGGLIDFSSTNSLYYLVLAFACVVIGLLLWIGRTRFGDSLRTLRDNDTLATSLGLNANRYRLGALVISGAAAGLGGVLYAYVQVGVQANYFTTTLGTQWVLMMFLGGVATLSGAFVGAMLVTFLPFVINLSPLEAQLAYGLLLVAIMALLPMGLTGALKDAYSAFARRVGGWYGP